MSQQFSEGSRLGSYVLAKVLGSGGNGVVWRARSNARSFALKLLKHSNNPKQLRRFRSEIRALTALKDQTGILPIVDFDLPDLSKNAPAWYTMPIATPVLRHVRTLKRNRLFVITRGIIEITNTLVRLHAMKIHHRDIKPSNMYVHSGHWVLSDFGLVELPSKERLTSSKEQVGARWTIAPEMQRDPLHSDGAMADIYSLAKSYWILLSGIKAGFEGKYDPYDTQIGLRFLTSGEFLVTIDSLLQRATDNNPNDRPSADEFEKVLTEWISIRDDFMSTNPLEWDDLKRRLFPLTVPDRAEWTDIDAIIDVLNVLGKVEGLNHLFLPTGGGLDLTGAQRSVEPDCIDLDLQGLGYVVKPRRLLFECFRADQSWNYFRLEADHLSPSGVYESSASIREEVAEIRPGFYVDRSVFDNNEYEGRPLPSTARVVSRFFSGSFVIFSKTSVYNQVSETYDGRHNSMNSDQFRDYIARSIQQIKKLQK